MIAIVSLTVAACHSGPTTPALSLDGAIEAHAELGFGNPPLVGDLLIRAPDEIDGARYRVDLDADGVPDETGPLGLGVRIGYRFTRPGVHRIGVEVVTGASRWTLAVPVVVNDVSATRATARTSLPATIVGLAHSGDRGEVYATTFEWFEGGFTVHRLAASNLEVRDRLPVDDPSLARPAFTYGMALSPGDSLLFIAAIDSLLVARLDPLEFAGSRLGVAPGSYVERTTNGDLVIGGNRWIERVDPQTGESVRRDLGTRGTFALSDSGDLIAFLPREGDRVWILDAITLEDLRVLTLPAGLPSGLAVEFGPGESVVYAVVGDHRPDDSLLAIETHTGEILRRVRLGRELRSFDPPRSSPAALAGGGRYVVFSTRAGPLFIDTRTHLPAFRFDRVEDVRECCEVRASATEPIVFSAEGRDLVRIRFGR